MLSSDFSKKAQSKLKLQNVKYNKRAYRTTPAAKIPSGTNTFIHSAYLYSASLSALLFRGAPDYSIDK